MRRIIGISTFLADIQGNRTLYVDPSALEQMNQGRRRATRTKTLDGGAVTYDAGYSPADVTLTIKVADTYGYNGEYFAMLVKTYNLIQITTDTGVYSAVPYRWAVEDGISTLEALVMEQLA